MMPKQNTKFLRFGAQLFLASTCLALSTFVAFRLGFGIAATGFLYLIIIVPSALIGSFIASIAISVAAALCLNYFFTPPIFSLAVEKPEDILSLVVFLMSSLIVTGLETARTRAVRRIIDREAALREQASLLRRTGRWDGELVHTKADGTKVVVASRWSLQRDEQQRPLVILEVNSNITERRRAEEKVLRAEFARLARVNTLGELTASIAHEVNQPLAAIVNGAIACLRWLNRETPNLDEARRAVEWIIKEGNRAGEVIRRVRALASNASTQEAPLDINDVISEVIALMQLELDRHRVAPRMELAPALPVVLADRVELQQVIINLVMNGIDAMEPITNRRRELVIGSRRDKADQILVTVEDCGVGISAENADRLFNAFFTTKSDGMGMGLRISRSIIEAHGGRLSAANNSGPGATFQFTLPLNEEITP
jgi:C4-dicarboxylate-specific signal transduction histidine kinase